MDGMSFSVESLYFSIQSLKLLDENLNELYSYLNSIDLSGVQLSNEGLLTKGKSAISDIITDNNDGLRKRLEDTKNVLLENDAEAALLFSMLDGEFLTETGEIDSEKLMSAIVDVVSKQEDFFATAEEFSKSIEEYQKKLDKISQQIKVYENQKGMFNGFLTSSMDYNTIKNSLDNSNDAEVMVKQLESEKEALFQAMSMLQVLRDYSLNSAFSLYTQYDDFESVVANGRKLFSSEYNEQLKYFTSEEKNIATYLLNTGAKERLEQFFDLKEDVVHQRQGMEMAEDVMRLVKSYYGEDGIDGNWEDVLPNAGAVMTLAGAGFFDGIGNFFDGLENLFTADGKVSADQYKTSYLVQMLQEFYGDEGFMSLFATGTYEISNSIGNMAVPMAVSAITHCPQLGTTLMGLSAAGNSREQGLQSGMTNMEAWLYGALSGTSEAVIGYFLGGIPGMNHLDEVAELPGLKGYITKMFMEGFEESTQSILDPFFAATASFVTGNEVDEIKVDWNDVFKSGIYGAITAGLLNGGQLFTSAVDVNKSTDMKFEIDGETFVVPSKFAKDFVDKFGTKDMTDPAVQSEFKKELIRLSDGELRNVSEESSVTIDTAKGEGIVNTSSEAVGSSDNVTIMLDGNKYELSPESRDQIFKKLEGKNLSNPEVKAEFKELVKENRLKTDTVDVNTSNVVEEGPLTLDIGKGEGIVNTSSETAKNSDNVTIMLDGNTYELSSESRDQILQKLEGKNLSNPEVKAEFKELVKENRLKTNSYEVNETIVGVSSEIKNDSSNINLEVDGVIYSLSPESRNQLLEKFEGQNLSDAKVRESYKTAIKDLVRKSSSGASVAAMVAGPQILRENTSLGSSIGTNLSSDTTFLRNKFTSETQTPADAWSELVEFSKKHDGKRLSALEQRRFNSLLNKYRQQVSNPLSNDGTVVNEAELDMKIFGEHLDRTQRGYNNLLAKQFNLRFKLDSIEARKILGKPLGLDAAIENGLRTELNRVNQMMESIRRSSSDLIVVTSYDAAAKVSHFVINQDSYNDAVDIRNALWGRLRAITDRVQRGVASQIEQENIPDLMKKCSEQSDFVNLIEEKSKGRNDIKFASVIDESVLDVALYGKKLNRTEFGLRALKTRLTQKEAEYKSIFSRILIGNNFSLEQIKNFTSEIVKLDGILTEINRLSSAISSVTRSLARNVVQNASTVGQKVAVGLKNVTTAPRNFISNLRGVNGSTANRTASVANIDTLAQEYFGKTFTHDQQGYFEVAEIRDNAWLELQALDSKIKNGINVDSERYNVVLKQFNNALEISKGLETMQEIPIISSSLPFDGLNIFSSFESSKMAISKAINLANSVSHGKFNALEAIETYLKTGNETVLGSQGNLKALATNMDNGILQGIYNQLVQKQGVQLETNVSGDVDYKSLDDLNNNSQHTFIKEIANSSGNPNVVVEKTSENTLSDGDMKSPDEETIFEDIDPEVFGLNLFLQGDIENGSGALFNSEENVGYSDESGRNITNTKSSEHFDRTFTHDQQGYNKVIAELRQAIAIANFNLKGKKALDLLKLYIDTGNLNVLDENIYLKNVVKKIQPEMVEIAYRQLVSEQKDGYVGSLVPDLESNDNNLPSDKKTSFMFPGTLEGSPNKGDVPKSIKVANETVTPNQQTGDRLLGKETVPFDVHSEIGKKVDISQFSNTKDLMKHLCNRSLVETGGNFDKKSASLFLQYMKSKDRIIDPGYYDIFGSGESAHPNLTAVFDDGGSGASVIPNSKKRFSREQMIEMQRSQYDFRITINNSSNINIDNAIKYVSTLISECNKRGIDVRMKNYWERDAIILYCQNDQMIDIVTLLEELSDPSKFGEEISSVTKSFGPRKPFAVGLNDDSYYGISMYVNELPFGKKSTNIYDSLILIGGGDTFSAYIGNTVKNAYNNLLAKYNNDVDKITDGEFYDEMIRVHKTYMFGSPDAKENIPLWMNRRNYLEMFGSSKTNDVPSSSTRLFIPGDLSDANNNAAGNSSPTEEQKVATEKPTSMFRKRKPNVLTKLVEYFKPINNAALGSRGNLQEPVTKMGEVGLTENYNQSLEEKNKNEQDEIPAIIEDNNPNVIISSDLSTVKSSDELISLLFNSNSLRANEVRDRRVASDWLSERKKGVKSLYKYPLDVKYDESILGAKGLVFEGGKIISGTPVDVEVKASDGSVRKKKRYKFQMKTMEELATRGNFDYRITITNSNQITTDEISDFLEIFINEANKRNLTLRAKTFCGKDLFILYCDKSELLGTVQLLEDLKNSSKYGNLVTSAIEHFGPLKQFSATVGNDSYYGISMAHSEPDINYYNDIVSGKVKSARSMYYGGAPVDTFGGYIEDSILEPTYKKLLDKYNGDISRITEDEFYAEVVKAHKKYMFGDENSSENIPFWMNRRNYQDYVSTSETIVDKTV